MPGRHRFGGGPRGGEWFVARDEETGVASQGETRSAALVNLAEAIELRAEPIPDDPELDEPNAAWFDERFHFTARLRAVL